MTSDNNPTNETEEQAPGTQHPARVYFALLGAKGPFYSELTVAQGIIADYARQGLDARASTWSARHCSERMVAYLANDLGIRQFLDLGCGYPLEPNMHQIARAVSPDARCLLVDSDPIVADYWDLELSVAPAEHEHVRFLHADVTDVDEVLGSPQVAEILDLNEPVGLLVNNVLCFISDRSRPHHMMARYVEALAPGSYVTINHPTGDLRDMSKVVDVYNANAADGPLHLRSHEQILRFFDGLVLQDPGLVLTHSWRPDIVVPHPPGMPRTPRVASSGISDVSDSKLAAVARKE
ncbi:SAM-dependent methyltransferase [Streptomyces lydicus]|uniref:SAM-dependent methyltransferase n=1 Tax=Streptomyces lydicus TaxID=47763 RepID=UPI00378CD03B